MSKEFYRKSVLSCSFKVDPNNTEIHLLPEVGSLLLYIDHPELSEPYINLKWSRYDRKRIYILPSDLKLDISQVEVYIEEADFQYCLKLLAKS